MKIWLLFLFGCFLAGALSLRHKGTGERALGLLAVSVVVAAAFYSGRFG